MNFFGLVDVPVAFYHMAQHAFGRLTTDERDFIPAMEQRQVFVIARAWVAIYVAVVAACFWFNAVTGHGLDLATMEGIRPVRPAPHDQRRSMSL